MPDWRDFLDHEARGARYLPWKEVARATGLSRTTAWRLQKRDDFPAPYAISPGRVGYREDEVEAWRVSRDLRGARVRPSLAEPQGAAPTVLPSRGAVRVSEARNMEVKAAPSQAAPSPAAGSPPVAPQPASRSNLGPRSKLARAGRRGSEHARAIAQQMMFDF